MKSVGWYSVPAQSQTVYNRFRLVEFIQTQRCHLSLPLNRVLHPSVPTTRSIPTLSHIYIYIEQPVIWIRRSSSLCLSVCACPQFSICNCRYGVFVCLRVCVYAVKRVSAFTTLRRESQVTCVYRQWGWCFSGAESISKTLTHGQFAKINANRGQRIYWWRIFGKTNL